MWTLDKIIQWLSETCYLQFLNEINCTQQIPCNLQYKYLSKTQNNSFCLKVTSLNLPSQIGLNVYTCIYFLPNSYMY